MSNLSGYPTRSFKESQKFLVEDPSTGTASLVLGSDLVSYITPQLDSVIAESTRVAAENTDYEVGKVIQTTGSTSPGDNFAAVYLVVEGGTGDFPMVNGNDLLTIRGDEFLREQLNQDPSTGDGVLLVDGAMIYRNSISEIESIPATDGLQVSLSGSRSGIFKFDSSDLSSEVAADPLQGIYIAPSGEDGSNGAWVRIVSGDVVYPEWWGGNPDESGGTGTDNAPAINAAIQSGYKTVFLRTGRWGLRSSIQITESNIKLVGQSMLATVVVSLETSFSPVNAYVVVKIQPWNGYIGNMRFRTGTILYTGWGISAIGGGVDGQGNLFSTHIDKIWCDFAPNAAGFFTGGIFDSWVTDCQFEAINYRFLLVGSVQGNATLFNNINDIGGRRPFIESTEITRAMSFSNIVIRSTVGNVGRDNNWWMDMENADDVRVSNMTWFPGSTTLDPTSTSYTGLFRFVGCTNTVVSNIACEVTTAGQPTTVPLGIEVDGSDVQFNNFRLTDNGSSKVIEPVKIKGTDNRIVFNGLNIKGGTNDQISVEGSVTGTMLITGSYLTNSGARIIRYTSAASSELDLSVKNSQLLNAYYGNSGANAIVLQGTGDVEFTGVTVGRDKDGETADLSDVDSIFQHAGSGNYRIEGLVVKRYPVQSIIYEFTTNKPVGHLLIGEKDLADDGSLFLPAFTQGYVWAQCDVEAGSFVVDAVGGTSTKISGTTNTAETNTDTNLCVFVSTGIPRVSNRLGAANNTTVTYQFI